MPSKDPFVRLMEQARGLSCDEFVKMNESGRPNARDLVSIEDLAVELGVSIRTLRRWNKLPGAPKRYRRRRRDMYLRADVQHWFEQRARRLGATKAGGDTPDDGSA